MASSTSTGAVLIVLLLCQIAMPCLAREWSVGGSLGWAPHVNYPEWVMGKPFFVNDVLEFKYRAPHNVVQVSQSDLANCDPTNSLFYESSGTTSYTLSRPGTYFFISGAQGDCASGMRLALNVM